MSICRVNEPIILEFYAYILAGGQYGSALQAAATLGQLEITELLLHHKADVDLQGKSLLS